MDYYFVLRDASTKGKVLRQAQEPSFKFQVVSEVKKVVSELGLDRFASALMWVLGYVFGLPKDRMIWEPKENVGRFLLGEIMLMGNFGHDDDRYRLSKDDSHLKRFMQMTKSKFRFVKYFPSEVFWQPVDTFFRFFEIRSIRRNAARMK